MIFPAFTVDQRVNGYLASLSKRMHVQSTNRYMKFEREIKRNNDTFLNEQNKYYH